MIRGENMVRPAYPVVILIALVILLALASGCTGQGGGSQTPAPTPLKPTPRVTTPRVTTPPSFPTATTVPVTTAVTPSWTPGVITQDGAAIQIRGDVLGFKASQANFIDEIRFTVVLAPRAEPATFEVPNTQIIFKKAGVPEYGVNYLIVSGDINGNQILEPGETFGVSIRFFSDASQKAIYPGQDFVMAIKNPPSPPVTVAAKAPPVLSDGPMVLATAAP